MREILVSGRVHALVSDEDYELVAAFNWFLTGNGYAFRWLPRNGDEYCSRHEIQDRRSP